MTAGPALPCPCCRRTLGPDSWAGADGGACRQCGVDFEFRAFPALQARRAPVAVQTALLAEDSVCFFHAENRAEAICERCGRLLCPVCTVPFAGQKVCPTCIASSRGSQAPALVRERVLHDALALAVALLPLLIWPFTVVTAPVALGIVIYGWNKPNSLVRGRGRARLIVAGVFAVGQIGAWLAVLILWWQRK